MATNGINGANGVNGTTNGVHHDSEPTSRFDPTFTRRVVENMGPNVSPRSRQVLGSLIRHIHDFAREVELTNDEWMTGVHFINAVGQASTKTRNEAHRVSDVLGLESYVFFPFWLLLQFLSLLARFTLSVSVSLSLSSHK